MSRENQTVDVLFCHVHGLVHERGWIENAPADEPECREEPWSVVIADTVEQVQDGPVEDGPTDGFYTLKAGDLAFIYTVRGGLIPCKVLTVKEDGTTEIAVTAKRPGWDRGTWETIANPWVSLVNRSQVSYQRGRARVSGTLTMVTDEGRVLRR